MKAYNKRAWLNGAKSPSTGSVVCYFGPDVWDGKRTSMFIEVSSCSSVARLHQAGEESDDEYTKKVRKLSVEIGAYLAFLESLKTQR